MCVSVCMGYTESVMICREGVLLYQDTDTREETNVFTTSVFTTSVFTTSVFTTSVFTHTREETNVFTSGPLDPREQIAY